MMKYVEALELMLAGRAMARPNDLSHELIYFVRGSIDPASEEARTQADVSGCIPLKYFEFGDAGTVTRLPRFDARDLFGHTVTGWAPTAIDQLADDWDFAENVIAEDAVA
jgi:hypothetical protein